MPVTWKGNYDPNTPGIYTLTAEFSGYTYAKAHPYAVVTVEESKTASQTLTESCGRDSEAGADGRHGVPGGVQGGKDRRRHGGF